MKRYVVALLFSILLLFNSFYSKAMPNVVLYNSYDSQCIEDDTIKNKKRVLRPDFEVSDGYPCIGDTVWFSNLTLGEGLDISYWDFGDGRRTTTKDLNPYHIYHEEGFFDVYLTVVSDTKVTYKMELPKYIYVSAKPDISLLFTPDKTTIPLGQQLEVAVNQQYDEYEWTNSAKEIVGQDKTLDLTNTVSDFYKIRVVDENQCVNTFVFEINVTAPIPIDNNDQIEVVNNIITPNEDGYNDYLEVKNLVFYQQDLEVQIYNNWGDLVYSAKKYDNKWNANEGKPLDAGTYYYVMKSPGKKGLVGFIDVVR